jgi:hypothetical protein
MFPRVNAQQRFVLTNNRILILFIAVSINLTQESKLDCDSSRVKVVACVWMM